MKCQMSPPPVVYTICWLHSQVMELHLVESYVSQNKCKEEIPGVLEV